MQTAENDTRVLLSDAEVAEILKLKVRTLYQWRRDGVGPEYVKIGRTIRYRKDVVEQWIKEHEVKTGGASA